MRPQLDPRQWDISESWSSSAVVQILCKNEWILQLTILWMSIEYRWVVLEILFLKEQYILKIYRLK